MKRRLSVLPIALLLTAGPAVSDESGRIPFTPPAPGTVLQFDDGAEVRVTAADGRVVTATVARIGSPPRITVDFEDAVFTRRIATDRGTQTGALSYEGKALWPLRPGATHRFTMIARRGGSTVQTNRGTITVGPGLTTKTVAGRAIQVIRVDLTVTWERPNGQSGKGEYEYTIAPALGFYVERRHRFYSGDAPGPFRKRTLRRLIPPPK